MLTDSRACRPMLLAILVALLQTRASATPAADTKLSPCCFNNVQYAGVCQVQPAAKETCASILAYLNNPLSAGKTYCNSTSVRGGWKRTQCTP
jgi:hypothetical protein